MRAQSETDANVVGAGPNGLAAAITLARAGRSVRLLEMRDTVGGAARSGAITLPGFVHDVGASVFPLGVASPFLRTLPLEELGVKWIHPSAPLAHPLDDGTAAILEPSLAAMTATLGADGPAWRSLVEPFAGAAESLLREILAPPHVPAHPLLLARFGLHALRPACGLAATRFRTPHARALFAGLSAHDTQPPDYPATSAFGLLFAILGHTTGWPIVAGGTQKFSDALAAHFRSLGGEIETGRRVASLDELPPARATLLDVTPRQFAALAGSRLAASERNRVARFRYGPGIFKVDWALKAPIPWRAAACARAATVHVGGAIDEIAANEKAVARGEIPRSPFLILVQPTLFDPSRAPAGQHTAWAYCRVPNGSDADMLAAVEAQVERFAPGFRDCILARHTLGPAQLEALNPNLVGGDIAGGAMNLGQLLTRPFVKSNPYATGLPGVYLCSSSTPPGGGVHGMCGFHAATAVLRRELHR
ncbi:MAG TPA: NAD(P)/FAD-dependent oxidoreductase [Opitutus sp.]|nr:NAD(P)/FAD-dependent oxidoreductase [Opitutus sp.]